MADEPFFPADAARPKAPDTTASGTTASATMASVSTTTAKAVVRRPDAPVDGDDAPAVGAKPKLTAEEVHALLAVDHVNRPSKLTRTAKRSVILVPTGLIGFFLHVAFGDWGFVASIVLTIGALVWMARPLLTGSRDGWT